LEARCRASGMPTGIEKLGKPNRNKGVTSRI
jgi:hypothetical protein